MATFLAAWMVSACRRALDMFQTVITEEAMLVEPLRGTATLPAAADLVSLVWELTEEGFRRLPKQTIPAGFLSPAGPS